MTEMFWTKVSRDLEKMIDKHGLEYVLQQLACICIAKAEHIETNWQDHLTAAVWGRAHKAIMKAADNASVQTVSN
jgi:hypothetical protein